MLKGHFQRCFRGISKASIILILLGSITWCLTMVKSGWIYSYGMGFWGPNGHDGVWHISLAQSIANGSLQMPVFAGENIKNYHIGFDLFLAALHKLTFIPITNLYFQVLPVVFALLIGFFCCKFVYEWTKSARQAFWATFFIYFAGGWGWLVSLLRDGNINNESMFWSQQSISTLVNPPYAMSLAIMFIGLWVLLIGLRTKKRKLLIIAILLFGILAQIKIYAGLLIIGSLLVAGFWEQINRRGLTLIKVATGSLIFSIIFIAPIIKGASGVLVYKPFWLVETMFAFSDRFNWPKYAEAMVNYKTGNNLLRGIPAYVIGLLIFWFGNLGTRIIKEPLVFAWVKNPRKLGPVKIIFIFVIAAGILIPTFFVQRGTPWNTIQFVYYSLAFSGILAGMCLGSWLDVKNISVAKYMSTVLIVVLTLPTTIATLYYNYLPSRPPAMVSQEELKALEFLKYQPDGIVLTLPFDKNAADAAVNNPPRPLNLYESTAYVSAFSGKPVYLEDEVNLEITGYDWNQRRRNLEDYLETPTYKFLSENKIKYIYAKDDTSIGQNLLPIGTIYKSENIQIYSLQ